MFRVKPFSTLKNYLYNLLGDNKEMTYMIKATNFYTKMFGVK